ncbi:MAG: hypothetical protein KHX31_11730 [Akkermansia sp.]|uniref:tetratricopeptide repeat protein n=1 Tax=Akkermansia sp. TaxID=1872421 RepID=UPI0025C15CED|nr:hypothetical protein [Akkermansia sp.]MBS5509294.1 hypothetical protein [Akkermansia sp.]MCD8064659.1 hypothetical protein [Akkermansia sp.]
MSESLPPEKNARDRAFGIACWTLGALAFALLLMVGVSFSLSARTVVVEKVVETPVPVPVQQNPEGPATAEEGGEPDPASIAAVPAGSSEKPRSVEEMLRAADLSDPAGDPVPAAAAAPVPGREGVSVQSPLPAENPAEAMPPMTEEVAELVKAARYAQIDGDLKVAVVKLEQAMRLEPDNPVVLYYYGLTYEWLRNADKSREFFLKVYTQREKAGKYFARAAQHLQAGFSSPADLRGDMSFGTILEYRDPECPAGERVKLIVPILMKDGLNVRPEDLRVIVQFFDKVNGKKVEKTHAPEPSSRCVTEPADWADGEEIMEVTYYMPPLTEEETIAYGSLKYYGYTAKLYYKGEPMDCHASPPVLFLLEQMNQSSPSGMPEIYDGGLLPPVEASPVSDSYDSLLPP